jgi:hypothetical protein
MKTKKSFFTFLMLVAVAAGANAQVTKGQRGDSGGGTANFNLKELKFVAVPGGAAGVPGPSRAVAWGNPDTGAHGFYIRLPGQWESGFHFHNASYVAVVAQGTVWNNYRGQDKPVVLTVGGYFATDGGVVHNTRCVSKEPCIFYVQMDKAFDALPPAKP